MKGKQGFQKGHKVLRKNYFMSEETRRKMSVAKKGIKISKEVRKKISDGCKRNKVGKWLQNLPPRKHSLEAREKISKANREEKNHFWRGGITKKHLAIRNSFEYKLWRTAVFERDNYTCIWCGQKGGRLNTDHIKPFAYFPELRFAIDNGRTLCVECHKKTDTFGSRNVNYKPTTKNI